MKNLLVAPDGKSLYFLDVTKADDVKLMRYHTAKRTVTGEIKLADNTRTMFLTSDGKTIYAAASPKGADGAIGIIQKIDASEMKLLKSITVAVNPFSIAANNGGMVYVAGQDARLAAVDMKDTFATLASWRPPRVSQRRVLPSQLSVTSACSPRKTPSFIPPRYPG